MEERIKACGRNACEKMSVEINSLRAGGTVVIARDGLGAGRRAARNSLCADRIQRIAYPIRHAMYCQQSA